MSREYNEYLKDHRDNVNRAFQWFRENLPELFEELPDYEVYTNCQWEHDKSKNDWEEYEPYDRYFYGNNKSYKVVNDFKVAWLRHIHNNPHHWQYWILINDDPNEGEIILDMPEKYVIEMICDWWSFSFRSENLYEIFDWYDKRKDYMKLSENTREYVEDILDRIKKKLDETNE